MRTPTSRWIVPIVALALVMAACGDDDVASTASTRRAPSTTEAPVTTEAVATTTLPPVTTTQESTTTTVAPTTIAVATTSTTVAATTTTVFELSESEVDALGAWLELADEVEALADRAMVEVEEFSGALRGVSAADMSEDGWLDACCAEPRDALLALADEIHEKLIAAEDLLPELGKASADPAARYLRSAQIAALNFRPFLAELERTNNKSIVIDGFPTMITHTILGCLRACIVGDADLWTYAVTDYPDLLGQTVWNFDASIGDFEPQNFLGTGNGHLVLYRRAGASGREDLVLAVTSDLVVADTLLLSTGTEARYLSLSCTDKAVALFEGTDPEATCESILGAVRVWKLDENARFVVYR